jgi:hypothetical protein
MAERSFLKRAAGVANHVLLGAVSSLALGAVVLGASPSVASATSSSAPAVPYACDIAGLIHTTLNIQIAATAPVSVKAGSTFSLTGVQSTTVIPVNLLTAIFNLDPKTTAIAGTVVTFDVNATNASPATINSAATPYTFSTPVKKGQQTPADVVTPAKPTTIGPFTAGTGSSITITPGNIQINTKLGNVVCTAPTTFPAGATWTIAVKGGSGVPGAFTGEPWASPYYWWLVGLTAVGGVGAIECGLVVRKKRLTVRVR